jgi:hypothetical protein
MKRIWYGLAILIIGGGVIFLGYYFRPKAKSNLTYLDNAPSSTVPGASQAQNQTGETEGFKPVFKEPVLAYSPYENGVMGVDNSGRIIQTDGKNETVLSSSSISYVFAASISYDRKFVLLAVGENSGAQFRIWNSGKNTWRFLPSGVFSPSFSPSAHQLLYLENTSLGTRLSILNLDSASSRGTAVATFPLTDLSAKWISADKVELKDKNALLVPSSDFIYSLSRKTTTPTITEKNGLSVSWSSSAKNALALLGQARGGGLFLIDNSGQILQTLNIITLPEKCAWSGDQVLFCAMPQNADAFKIPLPDAFYKNHSFAYDNFYKINAANGDVTPVLENKNGLDAQSLAVFGDNLYFINRLDGELYSLPIPK